MTPAGSASDWTVAGVLGSAGDRTESVPTSLPDIPRIFDPRSGYRFGVQLVHADPELIASVGPRIRKSPFFDDTVRAGLTSVSCYNHMWIPMSYGDPEAEYRRLTEAVTMWDVAAQRHVRVQGPDADELVQHVTTVDVSEVEVGSGAYAPMVDHRGTLINDPVLLHMAPEEWRFSVADADLGLWLKAIANERSRGEVVELDTATLAVQGPASAAVMESLDVDVDAMDDFELRSASIDGVSVTVSRSGWSNQGGYEIFLDDPRHAGRLWSNVASAGASHGIGPGAPNPSERIENVLLSYGTDTGYDADPFELGLDSVMDLDSVDFIGRDALRSIQSDGPDRRLRGVVIAGPRLDTLPHPTTVSNGGDVLGELRASAWSPRFSANLGLALLEADVEPGATATTTLPVGVRDLAVVILPFDEADVAPLRR